MLSTILVCLTRFSSSTPTTDWFESASSICCLKIHYFDKSLSWYQQSIFPLCLMEVIVVVNGKTGHIRLLQVCAGLTPIRKHPAIYHLGTKTKTQRYSYPPSTASPSSWSPWLSLVTLPDQMLETALRFSRLPLHVNRHWWWRWLRLKVGEELDPCSIINAHPSMLNLHVNRHWRWCWLWLQVGEELDPCSSINASPSLLKAHC